MVGDRYIAELEARIEFLRDEIAKRDARIAELEARIAEIEKYLAAVRFGLSN